MVNIYILHTSLEKKSFVPILQNYPASIAAVEKKFETHFTPKIAARFQWFFRETIHGHSTDSKRSPFFSYIHTILIYLRGLLSFFPHICINNVCMYVHKGTTHYRVYFYRCVPTICIYYSIQYISANTSPRESFATTCIRLCSTHSPICYLFLLFHASLFS